MFRTVSNGRAAMIAQQEKLDSISNNLANVSTFGYKRVDVSFQDLVYETMNRKGVPNSPEKKDNINGTGVKAGNWYRDNKQGSMVETHKKTDMFIKGEGYFQLSLNDGKKVYTRNGSFVVDSAGQLVDKNGNKLSVEITGEGREAINKGFILKEDNFSVNSAGEIYVNTENTTIRYGKINLFNTIGQDSMMSLGDNLYTPKPNTQLYGVTGSEIIGGYIEGSNVDIGKEMVDMITTQRAFELGSRAVRTADEMWGLVNNLKSR